MHMGFKSALVVTLLMLFAAAGPAWAEDFTFTVPVELSNLPPEINAGTAFCELIIKETGRATMTAGNRGRGFAIAGGAYRGELTIAFNANPGIEPARVTHYKCYLVLRGTLRGAPIEYNFRDEGYTLPLPLAPGATFTPRVTAPVR